MVSSDNLPLRSRNAAASRGSRAMVWFLATKAALHRDVRNHRRNVLHDFIDPSTYQSGIVRDFLDRGPVRWNVIGKLAGLRVDAEGEQTVERGLETLKMQ